MFNNFKIAFHVRNTYVVNQVIFAFTKLPLIGKFFSNNLYGERGLKILGAVIAVIKEFIKTIGYKILYILCFLSLATSNYQNINPALFLHIYLFLSIIGAFSNTEIFSPSKDKYYLMVLMKMDAKNNTIINFLYFLGTTFLGQFLGILLLLRNLIPWYYALLLPLMTVLLKCIAIAIYFYRMKKSGKIINENKPASYPIYFLMLSIFLFLAYGLPFFNIVLPLQVTLLLYIPILLFGILSLRKIITYNHYQKLYKDLLKEDAVFLTKNNTALATRETSRKQISVDTNITSDKEGFAYFHELFVKRHKKLLKDYAIKTAIVIAIISAGLLIAVSFIPSFHDSINKAFVVFLSYALLLMYFINTGEKITNVMFMNCDHSMLVYRFYKEPNTLLSLFKERLKTVITINLIPTLTLAISLCLLLWASGGTNTFLNYIVLFLSIISMSIFFSVHRLIIYYLMQPYSIGMEIKNFAYSLVNLGTYYFAYYIAGMRLPILTFGSISIVFAILYSITSLLLVKKYAPKTFRLK
ncbi:MAG: hypothetical protein PHN72_01730 [Bacilli bacterium]|nr:hypothetical protein [Bacilli bacterium]